MVGVSKRHSCLLEAVGAGFMAEMRIGFEAGSYLRLIDFVYH